MAICAIVDDRVVKGPAAVDGHRFDDLARRLARTTRRGVVKMMVSGAVAGSFTPIQQRSASADQVCSSTTLQTCITQATLHRDAELEGCKQQPNDPSGPGWGGAIINGCKIAVYRKYHIALERCERAQCKKGQCLNNRCCEGATCCPPGERQCGDDSAFNYIPAYCCADDRICCGADCCSSGSVCCAEIDFGFPGIRNPSRKDVCADLTSNSKHCGECGHECDECEVCRDGACVSTCDTDKCDRCIDGTCVPVCGPCETCTQGGTWPTCEPVDCGSPCLQCVNEACAPIDCGACQTCDTGSGCIPVDCGNLCLECIEDACAPKECPPCTECDPADGGCKPIDCGGPCAECVEDACIPKACDDPCQECVDGSCVSKTCEGCETCDPRTGTCVSSCDGEQTCCGGSCADTTCSDGQSFNPATCSCECAVTCPDGQPPDPATCLCGCAAVSCTEGQTQNPSTCECECSGFQTGCAPNEVCQDGACTAVCADTSGGGVHNGTFVACAGDNGSFIGCFCNTCGTTCRHSQGFACCSDGCQYVVTTCAGMGH